jgi:DNA processing protein
MLAVVGTRNASSLGARMARKLAGELSEAGFVIVSGLARGIDALAHHAALDGGTIAVQAGGLDIHYPAENAGLARDIAKRGLCLSEQPFGLDPQARHFPQRNRIVSGLSRALIVVEAAARSGSLLTAKNALDQGREVMAVPGHPMDTRASGCNALIRDGATLVRSAEDVIEALGPAEMAQTDPQASLPLQGAPQPDPTPERPWRDRAALNSRILAQLGPAPVAEDQLLRDLGLSAGEAAPSLARMELDGQVTRQPGGLISIGIGQQRGGGKKVP